MPASAMDRGMISLRNESRTTVRRIAARDTGEQAKAARLMLSMDKALERKARDDEEKWITVNGAHVKIDENGNATKGPKNLKKEINSGESGKQSGSSEGKQGSEANKSGVSRPATPAKTKTVTAKEFTPALDAAKATCPPDKAWRVDTTRSPEDFEAEGITTYTTEGGSTFALKKDGDIISVCKNQQTDAGTNARDLMAAAVQAGGTHLDSYDGNYGFYVRCGFEPVSRCKFDKQWAPPGWTEGRDAEEDIYFMKYVGVGKVKYRSVEEARQDIPYSADYDSAEAVVKKQVGGNT